MFIARHVLLGAFVVASVGTGMLAARPATGIRELSAAQSYNCRCCYDHVFNELDNHKFNNGNSADSTCSAGVDPSPNMALVWNSSLGLLANNRLSLAKDPDYSGPPEGSDMPEAPLYPASVSHSSSLFLGDLDPACDDDGYSCQEAGLDTATHPSHASFHSAAFGTCDEHVSCGGVWEPFFVAIAAGDYDEVARLYLKNLDAVILNEERGMLQFMDCAKRQIRHQVVANVEAIRSALTRAPATR